MYFKILYFEIKINRNMVYLTCYNSKISATVSGDQIKYLFEHFLNKQQQQQQNKTFTCNRLNEIYIDRKKERTT